MPKSQALNLAAFERPGRYINHEYNAAQPRGASYSVCLLYPDSYEIGVPNQAIAILYDILRKIKGVDVERCYLPWVDMIAALRENNLPLTSLESGKAVKDFDLIGITLPYELALTNVLEFLDLGKIAFDAEARTGDDPLIIGGGPSAFNPLPFARFFDAIAIGEGEEIITEIVLAHRALKEQRAGRKDVLKSLAGISGLYVPSVKQGVVQKRLVDDFANFPTVELPVVPYVETAQDRLVIEVLRGCARGCRFCQAGMIGRPVRERSADTIVKAVASGLACTGYDEVALSSLSSTDHSQIEDVLRRLGSMLANTDVSVSLPSQRLDAFGVNMAALAATGRKSGLTFAPEAGTQRLRDVINKNVSTDDLVSAITAAFASGWRRAKLYFMLGLPTEKDEDVEAIAELANLAYNTAKDAVPDIDRGKVRMVVSVGLFVPKAQTPFQWCGQIAADEFKRRVQLLRSAKLHKGIDLSWSDPKMSMLEAVIARGDERIADIIEQAWRNGARFDAWSELSQPSAWDLAAEQLGLDLQQLASKEFELDAQLPWSQISCGIDSAFLQDEYRKAFDATTTVDCTFDQCSSCGVCSTLQTHNVLAGERCG